MAAKSAIARVLYKEIRDGDRKKFIARSNDEPAEGGGARDLRFSGLQELRPVIEAMFPTPELVERKRSGTADVFRHKGVLRWEEQTVAGAWEVKSEVVYVEPPQDKRPNEWRIARVHSYSVFRQAKIPLEQEGNRVMLLLIQLKDGSIWPQFTTEQSLRQDKWDSRVKNPIVSCLDAKRHPGYAVVGFVDLENKPGYCNGR